MADFAFPVNWSPREYQKKAWNYLEYGGKHLELICHRRWGKDDLSLHHAACKAHERVANYWHMLPEYEQARKAIWTAVNAHTGKLRIDEAFPHELRKSTNNTDMSITFHNGSRWQVVGSDRYNSLVGAGVAGLVYSEWPLANPNARAYLSPMIRENQGWQIFIGTSRGRNHGYRTFKAAEKTPGAMAILQTAYQTPVFSQEDLNAELINLMATYGEDYGRAKFEQEYLCSFDAANIGAILARQIGKNEADGLISDDIDFDPYGAPMVLSLDIGRNDSTCVYFWQPRLGGYVVFDHLVGWGIDAEEWVEKIKDKISQYHLEGYKTPLGKIWLPHDARAKTFSAKHSAMETFLSAFGAKHVDVIPVSRKMDRINAARVLMPRISFNATKCATGIEALRNWSFKYDEERKDFSLEPDHNWASHDGDAFSYGCQIMRLAEPPKPGPEAIRGITVGNIHGVTLNEMWKERPQKGWSI